MSRGYDFRSRTRESLDTADMVKVAMRTHDHEVEARVLAAQDLTMDEVLQLQDRGVGLAIVRAAPGVDDNCKGKVQIEFDVDEWKLRVLVMMDNYVGRIIQSRAMVRRSDRRRCALMSICETHGCCDEWLMELAKRSGPN